MDNVNNSILKITEKSLYVLEYMIENNQNEFTLAKLSKELNLNKTVLYRILQTFLNRGYLIKNEVNDSYLIGFKLIEIGSRAQEKIKLISITRPFLEELSAMTNETANLGILSNLDVIYIDKVESSNFLRADLRVGTKVPAYCSAMGKTLLSYTKNKNKLENIEFEEHAPNTITSLTDLLKEIESIKSVGYSLDDEEYIPGIRCIAAPILASNEEAIAAISIAGPKFRIHDERINELVELLFATSAKLNDKVSTSM